MSDNPYSAPTSSPPGQQPGDDQMTPIDWVLCIICPLIGCIIGIVRLIQGKKHGAIMIGVSIGFSVLWNLISFAIRTAAG